MKWRNRRGSLKITSWKDIQEVAVIILIAVIIIGMSFDFISWKQAMGAIKRELPQGAMIADGGGSMNYSPFRWRGKLYGRVYLFADEDLNVESRNIKWTDGKFYNMDGSLDGTIKGISGVDIPLEMTSQPDNPLVISHGKTIIKNKDGEHSFEIWTYLLNKGGKQYRTVFNGYEEVDYPITTALISSYRRQIDPNNTIKPEDITWLTTFTHDSLHKYIMNLFTSQESYKAFESPNVYALRLDQIILNKVREKKVYKKEWTGERKGAVIGIIYKLDGKTYVQVHYNAWYIGCKGGGFTWSFWGK